MADDGETDAGVGIHSDRLFAESAGFLDRAIEFGNQALDTVEEDRVKSAADMAYGALLAQAALVEAVRDLSVGVKRLERLAEGIEHQLRFRQDPLPAHGHTLHLG